MSNPIPLQRGQTYHIYNRGNNREHIFVEDRNYRHFLRLYARHVEPVADTFAYCLLPNHFHFLVYVRDVGDSPAVRTPSQCFSNLFNAYAKAFNRTYDRTGALFQRPFGRVPVSSDAYFARLVTYVHQNPEKHGLINDFRSWRHSSYHTHLLDGPTRLRRDVVLGWFGGRESFKMAHDHPADMRSLVSLMGDSETET